MIPSKTLRAAAFIISPAGVSAGEELRWTGTEDVMKLTAPKDPLILHVDSPLKLRSLTFDPGALNAIQIKGQTITLADGGSIAFAKLPGDVGMKKTSSATIASDLKVSGRISLANQNRHYLGGEKLVVAGKMKGNGNISIAGVKQGIVQLAGDNSEFTGAFVIETGSLMLSHSAALGSGTKPVTLNGGAVVMIENGILRWGADEQIADHVPVTFQGELPTLELHGHKERVGVLDLQGDARLDPGQDGELNFADSSQVNWDRDKVMMVLGGGTIRFGKDETALTNQQLRQIGFVDPAGFPTGTYTAKLSGDGKLLPTGDLVVPVNLPVDLSTEADARRRALYEVEGLLELTGDKTPLKKSGTVISFYGDSITWGGGYLNVIKKAISEGKETKDLGVRLINHGVNGGGVLTLRDGDKGTAHFGNTKPWPFSETLAEDKADVAVISIGVNDVWWRKTTPEAFEKALTDLVTQAKAAGARPVLATLAIMNEKVGERNAKCDAYADITRKVAKATGATLVDLRAAFMACMESESIVVRPGGAWTSDTKLLAHDGVHPNARGNQLLAGLIAQGIVQALENR